MSLQKFFMNSLEPSNLAASLEGPNIIGHFFETYLLSHTKGSSGPTMVNLYLIVQQSLMTLYHLNLYQYF